MSLAESVAGSSLPKIVHGHPLAEAVVKDHDWGDMVAPWVDTMPLTVAVYAVDSASAAPGWNDTVRASDDMLTVPLTACEPATRESAAPGARGVLKVTDTSPVAETPG